MDTFNYFVVILCILDDNIYKCIEKGIELLYLLFVYCMNILTSILAYFCDLEKIAKI